MKFFNIIMFCALFSGTIVLQGSDKDDKEAHNIFITDQFGFGYRNNEKDRNDFGLKSVYVVEKKEVKTTILHPSFGTRNCDAFFALVGLLTFADVIAANRSNGTKILESGAFGAAYQYFCPIMK